MEEAKYSATFKLPLKGIEVQFTVRADDESRAIQHIDDVKAYLDLLETAAGVLLPQEKEPLEQDEKMWPVDGYIAATCNGRDGLAHCLYMYGIGDWKCTTIYDSKFGELWFDPDWSQIWPEGTPPPDNKGARKQKQYFRSCPKRQVILKYWENKDGKITGHFDRVAAVGATAHARQANNQIPAEATRSNGFGSAEEPIHTGQLPILAKTHVMAIAQAATLKALYDKGVSAAEQVHELGDHWHDVLAAIERRAHWLAAPENADSVTRLLEQVKQKASEMVPF